LQVIEAHAALGRSVTIAALAGFLTESGSPEQQGVRFKRAKK
jgi:hypothetical protein